MQELFRLGAPELTAITARDAETDETPLHLLVRAERATIVQLLLDRAAALYASGDSLADASNQRTGSANYLSTTTRRISPQGSAGFEIKFLIQYKYSISICMFTILIDYCTYKLFISSYFSFKHLISNRYIVEYLRILQLIEFSLLSIGRFLRGPTSRRNLVLLNWVTWWHLWTQLLAMDERLFTMPYCLHWLGNLFAIICLFILYEGSLESNLWAGTTRWSRSFACLWSGERASTSSAGRRARTRFTWRRRARRAAHTSWRSCSSTPLGPSPRAHADSTHDSCATLYVFSALKGKPPIGIKKIVDLANKRVKE